MSWIIFIVVTHIVAYGVGRAHGRAAAGTDLAKAAEKIAVLFRKNK